MCAQRKNGATKEESDDEDGRDIVNDAVFGVRGELPVAFLLDESMRLENKIRQQVSLEDREYGSK